MAESRIIFILSIFISLLIFVYAKLDKSINVKFAYSILIQKNEYFRVVPNTDSVYLELSGKAKDLISLAIKKRQLNINFEPMKTGNFKIPIRNYIIVEPHIKLISVYPETLNILVEKIVRKPREVRVNITGSPKEGYTIDSIIVEPKVVDVIASESQIIGIKYVETNEIDISHRTEDFKTKVALKKFFEDIKIIPESVEVIIKISSLY
ncbi:MAG: YbbR-like domain-containing protein [candidate division WOR-3 bacterium]|nr:YbbR-like domain-containing protein [candidate division WOR-3 bacterium]MCX7947604.1 YbbR-like domain-containing protein [candidate division WOR-3 bacterium]MDW8150489.1 YbbR-like domain-containing protein [candidate division WOR-3 bacterium]